MTVKDIFELRKQGRIEEAYEAIRPMYAEHKGKYTSLAMFWTAHDILRKRMGEGRIEEARKIHQAMERMMPYVEDTDGKAALALQNDRNRLSDSRNDHKSLSTPEKNLTADHLQLGSWGEQMAIDYLKGKGYQVLEHDWKSNHRDIDIVARKDNTLVFVEVKTRCKSDLMDPATAVDYQKRQSILKSIQHYVKYYQCSDPYRFDIISVVGAIGSVPEIKHLEDIHLF